MEKLDDHLKDLSEIRAMMEKSSKFLSLSGLSGVSAGIFALLGAFFALQKFKEVKITGFTEGLPFFYISLSLAVLLLALGFGIYFSVRNARRKNLPVWTNTTKYLLISLFIPLAAGGLFSIVLWYRGMPELIFSSTLIFYGLALLNASKYVMNEIQYLAIIEIILGLIAGITFGLIFWTIGFGLMHIIYGIYMYLKYEK
ncbi:MAG TPA: hypothetical protein VKA26_05430 [Ignavibacteriaceae bacterium]|nr:hypothetical protein [Ignavibacteriaceae bacterium]